MGKKSNERTSERRILLDMQLNTDCMKVIGCDSALGWYFQRIFNRILYPLSINFNYAQKDQVGILQQS